MQAIVSQLEELKDSGDASPENQNRANALMAELYQLAFEKKAKMMEKAQRIIERTGG